jgi:hypothetical protein
MALPPGDDTAGEAPCQRQKILASLPACVSNQAGPDRACRQQILALRDSPKSRAWPQGLDVDDLRCVGRRSGRN